MGKDQKDQSGIFREARKAAAKAVRAAKRGNEGEYRRQAKNFKKANKAFLKVHGYDCGETYESRYDCCYDSIHETVPSDSFVDEVVASSVLFEDAEVA